MASTWCERSELSNFLQAAGAGGGYKNTLQTTDKE
jgi:hypothetical protein